MLVTSLQPRVASSAGLLIADDEEAICFALARRARALGLLPIVASDGQIALDLFLQHPGEVAAAVLDWRMPRLDGLRTAELMRAAQPELPVCLLTAFDRDLPRIDLDQLGIRRVLAKPFDLAEFERVLVDWGLVGKPLAAAG